MSQGAANPRANPYAVGNRGPLRHPRVHVLTGEGRVHRSAWAPPGITDSDEIPLQTYHGIVDGISLPAWTRGPQEDEWSAAFNTFKEHLRALFREKNGHSREWSKLLFLYDEPARQDHEWPDMHEFDKGRWAGHKRTGQLWFLVQLLEDLWTIEDNKEKDLTRPKHLSNFFAPFLELKFSLLGIRATSLLLYNFNHDTAVGYPFDAFRDLLNSIAAPVHHQGALLGADEVQELEDATTEYKERVMSRIREEWEWRELAITVAPGGEPVVGTFYVAITVRNNKTKIESGGWDADEILHHAKILSGAIDTIRQISTQTPRHVAPTSAPGSQLPGLPPLQVEQFVRKLREQRSRSSSPSAAGL